MIQPRASRSYVKSQGVTVRCYGSPARRRSELDFDRPASARERLTRVAGADPNLDPVYAASLLRRAKALQTEADEVMRTLDVMAILAVLGQPEQIGSSVSGLMVWRDIDVTVRCQDVTLERVWDALRPILINPQITRLSYSNETGARSPTGEPADQRFYFVLRYETQKGKEWKIDVSVWTSDAPRPHLAQLTELERRLTRETTLAILWIKDVWHRLPVYPYEVGGSEVYDAVLEHGARCPDDFDRYLRKRGLPTR
jgi:hypothetical protein